VSLWKWWIAIAGTTLIAGGVAWMLKLWVIVATDGRVVATGAAGAFFDLGFYSLMVGSTGVGLRLAMNLETSLRVTLAVVSPFVFGVLFAIFSGIGYALVAIGRVIAGDAVPGYLLEEGGIFVSAVVGLVAGIWLVVDVVVRGVSDSTDGASGSRQVESQPRVR
jgi:hypothetical protein